MTTHATAQVCNAPAPDGHACDLTAGHSGPHEELEYGRLTTWSGPVPCCPGTEGHRDDCTTRPAGTAEAPADGHTDGLDITTYPVTHCDDAPGTEPS